MPLNFDSNVNFSQNHEYLNQQILETITVNVSDKSYCKYSQKNNKKPNLNVKHENSIYEKSDNSNSQKTETIFVP